MPWLYSDGSYLIFANKQTFLTKNNNKLIAVVIQSRHCNNTKYKLFVEYTDIDSVDAIKGNNNLFFIFISFLRVYLFIKKCFVSFLLGWTCSCMVGKRTVGCCSHIATTIYFLAYARHFDFDLKESNPGSFLDSLLVTIGSDSEEEDKNENDKENQGFDHDFFPTINQSSTQNSLITEKPSSSKSSLKHSLTFNSANEIPNPKKNPKESSILKKNTISKKPSTLSTPKGTPITNNLEILFNFRYFTSHLPEWGGFIDVKLEDFDNISFENFQHFNKTRITNTCTIDYFLFGFWYAYYLSKNGSVYFNNEDNFQLKVDLKKIIELIEKKEWNRAKTIWIFKYVKLKINPINEFTCFGSIESLFIDHVVTLQRHEYFCSCNPSCITSKAHLTIEKLGQSFLFSFNSYDCIHCNNDLNITCKFVKKPFLLFIQIVGPMNINDLPNELLVEDSSYHFLFSVFHKGNKRNINLNHFLSIFRLNQHNFLVDDLNKGVIGKNIPLDQLNWCVYYLR